MFGRGPKFEVEVDRNGPGNPIVTVRSADGRIVVRNSKTPSMLLNRQEAMAEAKRLYATLAAVR